MRVRLSNFRCELQKEKIKYSDITIHWYGDNKFYNVMIGEDT